MQYHNLTQDFLKSCLKFCMLQEFWSEKQVTSPMKISRNHNGRTFLMWFHTFFCPMLQYINFFLILAFNINCFTKIHSADHRIRQSADFSSRILFKWLNCSDDCILFSYFSSKMSSEKLMTTDELFENSTQVVRSSRHKNSWLQLCKNLMEARLGNFSQHHGVLFAFSLR